MRTVRTLPRYVENVHQEYLRQRANGSWFEWDHFLDQHIGLQYYEVGDACVDKDRAVREALHEQRIPVGERRDMEGLSTGATNWTTHYYTGYKVVAIEHDPQKIMSPHESHPHSSMIAFECLHDATGRYVRGGFRW